MKNDFSEKSEVYLFGLLPEVCIYSLVEDQYSKMYIPRKKCDCGGKEWEASTMEMFVGFEPKAVHRCIACKGVRLADRITTCKLMNSLSPYQENYKDC